MNKLIFIVLIFTGSVLADSKFTVVLPQDAKDYTVKPYEIIRNETLSLVLSKWLKKKYNSENLIWDVGDYSSIKDLSFSNDVKFTLSFNDSVLDLLRRLNSHHNIKDANLLLYSCLYSNQTLVIKAEKIINGGTKNECL